MNSIIIRNSIQTLSIVLTFSTFSVATAGIACAADAAKVAGDLKVDGIHFTSDNSVQTKASPWGNGDPNAQGNIGFMQGNVGIGTLTPSEQLELTGNLKLPATTATAGQIRQGDNTLIHTFGTANFFAGPSAGNLTMIGYGNTASGDSALQSNTNGSANTASGYSALYSNTSGNNNTASGNTALYLNTTGYYNTASGNHSLYSNTTGYGNTASGNYSLYSNTTGTYNTASGYYTLRYNTTGNHNTASGNYALYSNTTGNYNSALGDYADVTTGALTNATAIGYNAKVNASDKVRIGNTAVTVIEGQVGWSYPSDIRIKKDVEDIGFGLSFIKSLRPVQYRLIQGNERIDFGFIAQDIEARLGDGYNVLGIAEDADRSLSLRYTDFIAPMVKAMQEQQAEIETQRKEIENLKAQVGEIDTLKSELVAIKALLLPGRK